MTYHLIDFVVGWGIHPELPDFIFFEAGPGRETCTRRKKEKKKRNKRGEKERIEKRTGKRGKREEGSLDVRAFEFHMFFKSNDLFT
jgi:hypothetical protein